MDGTFHPPLPDLRPNYFARFVAVVLTTLGFTTSGRTAQLVVVPEFELPLASSSRILINDAAKL